MFELVSLVSRSSARRSVLALVAVLCLLGALMLAAPTLGVYYHS